MGSKDLNAQVTFRAEVAPGLIILRVKPVDWELPHFEPGQFAVLGLPGAAPRFEFTDGEDIAPEADKLIKRAYSIASSSKEKEYVEFYVALVSSGELTPRLFALKVGDMVHLSKKFTGMFTLDMAPQDSNLVLIATGTGVAPYMSMIRTTFSPSAKRHFAVLHGARHSWDLGYRSELATLSFHSTNFGYFPIISRPENEKGAWIGLAGHVQDLWTNKVLKSSGKFIPTPENTHIFVCGNPKMVENMQRILEEEGYKEHTKNEPGQLHIERFW